MRSWATYNTGASDQAGKQQHASETGAEQTRDGGAIDTEPWYLHWEAKVILNDIHRTLEPVLRTNRRFEEPRASVCRRSAVLLTSV